MKKLLSLLLVLGIVGSTGAAQKLDIKVKAPAKEESTLSWENEELKVEAQVAPYDDERMQVALTFKANDEEATVIAEPRVITYMNETQSFVLFEGQDSQLEVTITRSKAKEASLEVEVAKPEAEAVETTEEVKEESKEEEEAAQAAK